MRFKLNSPVETEVKEVIARSAKTAILEYVKSQDGIVLMIGWTKRVAKANVIIADLNFEVTAMIVD